MTDIVIRLRAKTYGPNLLGVPTSRLPSDIQLEAADEIDRLRSAYKELDDAFTKLDSESIHWSI